MLGAAGLLQGYRATSHWSSCDQLELLGAEPVEARMVRDRNRLTGAGVTSGIDFALALVAELRGSEVAQAIQLQMEYDPQPPFNAGSPQSASPAQVEAARAQ
ncbi:thiamine biosynthesis protein ThiJ|nr:thiamine biosynthesis protein ThiJ [Candidatus Pantoea persica]